MIDLVDFSRLRSGGAQQEAVLAAISCVNEMCQSVPADPAVDYSIRELQRLKSAVEKRWPLPSTIKEGIDLGPFAAKNIADWMPGLADALMGLDYALQHDGASLEYILPEGRSSPEEPVHADLSPRDIPIQLPEGTPPEEPASLSVMSSGRARRSARRA